MDRAPSIQTRTADLKSLHHNRRVRSGTSDRQSGTSINKFAGAHGFPKFVKVGAAMEHELRKVGTRGSHGWRFPKLLVIALFGLLPIGRLEAQAGGGSGTGHGILSVKNPPAERWRRSPRQDRPAQRY